MQKSHDILALKIVSRNSGKCLNLALGSMENGAVVDQFTCVDGGSSNEEWILMREYNSLEKVVSNFCPRMNNSDMYLTISRTKENRILKD